jgi:hypothetical protein
MANFLNDAEVKALLQGVGIDHPEPAPLNILDCFDFGDKKLYHLSVNSTEANKLIDEQPGTGISTFDSGRVLVSEETMLLLQLRYDTYEE